MTDPNRIFLFDTTLRDGAQTHGVDFSVADKIAIAEQLDRLGIDYIEGGWPGANPTDDAFFATPPALRHAKFTAFGMTKRAGRSADNDPGLAQVTRAGAAAVCLVGKTWDFHVTEALGVGLEENLDAIIDSLRLAAARGAETLFDCEHFFDGFKANPDHALACAKAAYHAGARWVVLCDTNGGTLPDEVAEITGQVIRAGVPGSHLGIHAHNDTETAVANSLAAVRAGARQIQGTLNGLGERCGNANLISLIPPLVLKLGYDTGVTEAGLGGLTEISRWFDERLNRASRPEAAYVGRNAFAHKGGLHASAVVKDPRLYEHVAPERVGNHREVVVSDQAGRSNILFRLMEFGIEAQPDHPRVKELAGLVKDRDQEGYAYDRAEASFELMARRHLGMAPEFQALRVPDFFDLERFSVTDERRYNARGHLVTESEAVVLVRIGNRARHEVAVGQGPVDALNNALRLALEPAYPELKDTRLIDFRVRILDTYTATQARPRVLIQSAGLDGATWSTIGVSHNIIEASYEALADSFTHRLLKAGVKAAA